MGLLIMTNAQMGTFSVGRNETFTVDSNLERFPPYGILNSWRPIFGVGLKTGNVKGIRTSVLRRRCCGTVYAMLKEESDKREVGGGVGGGGEVLEKELEFKPSFNEYLKIMESVKTGLETKQARKLGRNSFKNDLRQKYISRTPSGEKDDEDNVKLRRFEGHLDEEMVMTESRGEGDEVEGKFDRKSSVIRKSKDKLGVRGNYVDVKVKKTSRVHTLDGILHYQSSNVELKNSYLTNVTKFQGAKNSPVSLVDDRMSGNIIDMADEPVHDKSSLEMFATKSKSFERQKDGVKSCKIHSGTVERNNSNGQKATNSQIQTVGKVMNSRKILSVKSGDSSLKVERAAFNALEEGNDIMTSQEFLVWKWRRESRN